MARTSGLVRSARPRADAVAVAVGAASRDRDCCKRRRIAGKRRRRDLVFVDSVVTEQVVDAVRAWLVVRSIDRWFCAALAAAFVAVSFVAGSMK
jgi:hypothetical protein